MKKTVLTAILILLVIVLLAGCVSSSSGNSSGIKVKELRITSTAIDVVVNETLLITAEALYDDNTKSSKEIEWTSSDESVASVDKMTGKVIGLKAGAVEITATKDGKSAKILITVKEKAAPEVIVSKEVIPEGFIRIHYDNYKSAEQGLGLWLWDDFETISSNWPSGATSFKAEKKDEYGLYIDIKLKSNPKKIGFIVVNRTSAEKEGGDRVFEFSSGENELWIKAGTNLVSSRKIVIRFEKPENFDKAIIKYKTEKEIKEVAMEEYKPGWYKYEFSKIANLDFYITDSKGIEIKMPDKTDFKVKEGTNWISKDGILYERDPLVKEVDNITVEPGYGNVKLKWTMADSEGISGFEIQYINEKKVTKKVQAIKKEEREYLIEGLEPLDTLTITIKILIGSDLSVGKTQKVFIPHKNVVADEFMGKRMFVYLPDGYNESTEKYPVMYMFDGQNIFSKAYVATEWGVDETLDKLIKNGKVQKMIVVGLFHAGDKRSEEYTAYDYQLGRDFAENLSKKFIPYIEEKYRVLSGKENRGLMGSSRGGLAALYLINNYDEYFGFAAGVSPSEKWKFAEYKNFQKKDVRIWIDNGTADYVLGYARSPACREMVDGYVAQGHTYGDSVAFYEVKDSVHNETDWSKRVAYPFIMFKGIKTAKVTDFNISIEVFHDDKNNAICAANPVADYDNGFRMSLYSLAEYAISGKGTIDKKGIFMLNGESEAEITIKYAGITKMIKITATEIEAMRRKNLSSK